MCLFPVLIFSQIPSFCIPFPPISDHSSLSAFVLTRWPPHRTKRNKRKVVEKNIEWRSHFSPPIIISFSERTLGLALAPVSVEPKISDFLLGDPMAMSSPSRGAVLKISLFLFFPRPVTNFSVLLLVFRANFDSSPRYTWYPGVSRRKLQWIGTFPQFEQLSITVLGNHLILWDPRSFP